MKIKLLVVATVIVMAGSATAQSAFQGFYGQIATGYEGNQFTNTTTPYTFEFTGFSGSGVLNETNQNANGMPLVVGIGYNFSINNSWLLGIGADYSFITQETGTFTLTDQSGGWFRNNIKVENRFNIFVTPSYVVDKDKLVYFKAGYSGQTLKSSFSAQGSNSANQTGYVLGLGYKQIISGGFYGFAEGNYMNYGKANLSNSWSESGVSVNANPSVGASAYTLLVGVGYRF